MSRRSQDQWRLLLEGAKGRGLAASVFAKELGVSVSTLEKAQLRVGVWLGRGRPPWAIPQGDGSLLIPLGKRGETTHTQFARVEEEDAASLVQHWWRVDSNGYAYRNEGTAQKNLRYILMHRQIMGAPKGVQVDHQNRVRLDNRRQNLRFASFGQQADNAGLRKDNTSGFKGVSLTKSGRWCAQIQHRRSYYWLGTFDTPEEAAEAYAVKAKELKGAFAAPVRA